MKTELVKVETPKDCNTILLTSHFIKTVEDLHNALVNEVSEIKFGLAFCEASGTCLIRKTGTEQELVDAAVGEAQKLGCGHSVIIFLRGTWPIQVMKAIKSVEEVCTVHCATANSLEVIVAESEQGRGILGVIDGSKPKGIETDKDIRERKELLRKLGYKL